MTNEVRKPRVFKNVIHVKTHSMEGVVSVTHEINLLPFKIDLQEILPGDDSIRLSRLDWDEIKARMEYTNSYPRKSCAEFLERIERESKG